MTRGPMACQEDRISCSFQCIQVAAKQLVRDSVESLMLGAGMVGLESLPAFPAVV